MSPRDRLLWWLVHEHEFTLEVPFAGLSGTRKWRWDAARDDVMVACEYSGIGPGHRWNAGVTRDYRKLSEGQLAGWRIVVCNNELVNDGSCFELVEKALEA